MAGGLPGSPCLEEFLLPFSCMSVTEPTATRSTRHHAACVANREHVTCRLEDAPGGRAFYFWP